MATINSDDSLIMALNVVMFNAVPGKEFFQSLQETYDILNKNIFSLASLVYSSDIFKAQFSGLDNSTKTDIIMNIFGADTTDEAGELVHTFITSELDNSSSEGEIIFNILLFLASDGLDSSFDNMKNTIYNKIEVSQYYTLEQERSTISLDKMQAILSDVTYDDSSVTQAIEDLQVSLTATIDSIIIPDGNYTYGADINITLLFNDNIYINGTDITLTLTLGAVQKEATLYSYTDNSLTFNYKVEDGYFSESADVGVLANSINLGESTLTDEIGLDVDITFDSEQNSLALINDTKAPVYSLYNAHYDTDSNILNIYGSGFSTILEYNENSSLDIVDRIDFTKLIWDFNSDENTTYTTSYELTSSNITSAKIISNNHISIVISDALELETDENYGDLLGSDSLDIEVGFVLDKAGNISQVALVDDLILGIDGNINGSLSNDILYGSSNKDTILGSDGDDNLVGLEGNDILNGGSGNDTIKGGTGIDTLTGDAGNDTFVFVKGDSKPIFSVNFGIDKITDLKINSNNEDLIDLDVDVTAVNNSVTGNINQDTFITNMNILLSVSTNGFNTSVSGDISAAIVEAIGGDLEGNKYLAIDYNANNSFDENDLVIDITGSTILNFSADSFI